MDHARLEHHLAAPQGRAHVPRGAHSAAAGGAVCGDLVRIHLALDRDRVADAGFHAHGCGSTHAAASAVVSLVRGAPLLEAARVGVHEIAAELGGLSPGKLHAAEVAADALHRALGAVVAAEGALARAPGRALVAMSGGVDSAVAALLSGPSAVAVTLELWADEDNDAERSCCSAAAVRGARALAHRQGLPHLTLDMRAAFKQGVVDPWLADHADGLTPNPCIRCNGHVRLDGMLELAGRLGCPTLVTGHYVRTAEHDHPDGPLLRAAADLGKDQSYALAALDPRSLALLRFPLGELTKAEVRSRAAAAGLPVAAKPDSQDLCFLAGTDGPAFLQRHGALGDRPGDIVDRAGRVLGRHRGAHRFTVGQRRGIGVAAAEPLYVLATEPSSARVTVGTRTELRTARVLVRGARLHRDGGRVNRVKLRHRMAPLPAALDPAPGPGRHGRLQLALHEPAEGAAPGQIACLMDGDLVVGYGTIGLC